MVILITGGSGFIGTNLIDTLLLKGYTVVNFDKSMPLKKAQTSLWVKGNIMNLLDLQTAFTNYKPNVVIHLAARTDTLSNNIEDYKENTLGSKNVLDVINQNSSVKHAVITSTQYVYKSLGNPFQLYDDDYKAHTVYGQSKVITEQYTREANLNCAWTIIRPTNIWGPWHMRYPLELWKIIDKGFYIHPGKKEVIRTYGYVKNIVYQIVGIIESDLSKVDKKTYYLGDLPIDSYIWLNELSLQFIGKKVKRFPILFFQSLAFIGDVLRKFKVPFPLYAERFHNMVENYYAPTNIAINEFGLSHPNLKENIKESIEWVKTEGLEFFDYWKNK